MDKLIDFLNGFNVQTILVMIGVLWYFTRELKLGIKQDIEELKQVNTKQDDRSDKLYEMFVKMFNDDNCKIKED